jgi:predicted O-methyltransferase YrrM
MDGTTTQRVIRVAKNLLANPRWVSRYIRTGLLGRKSPLTLGLPWISWGAIEALDCELSPTMSVFEYGTGGSTVFLASRCKDVTSIEEDEAWFESTKEELDRRGLVNVQPVFASADFSTEEAFLASPYFIALPETPTYDLILIDGQDATGRFRPLCFQRAEKAIRPGGLIVVDDAWRYPDLLKTAHSRQHTTYRSVGPARKGVTQTDIYRY